MNTRHTWRAPYCGLLLLWAGAGPLAAQGDDAGIRLGQTPPAVRIEDLEGKPVDFARLTAGKPALIEFWAIWCPRCQALEPRMIAAHAHYGGRVHFVAVAVAVNETRAAVRRHLAQHPMPYRYLWDANGQAVRAFQAPTTSYVVVLNAAGRVVFTGVGEDQDLETALARAVAAN